jgi:Leucine-rich repeat (LRR) protein
MLLHINDCSLANISGWTGTIPKSISNLANLTVFSANNCQLSGELPSSLGALTELETLTLTRNQLSGKVPTSLCDLGADIQVDCTVECQCCTNYNCTDL